MNNLKIYVMRDGRIISLENPSLLNRGDYLSLGDNSGLVTHKDLTTLAIALRPDPKVEKIRVVTFNPRNLSTHILHEGILPGNNSVGITYARGDLSYSNLDSSLEQKEIEAYSAFLELSHRDFSNTKGKRSVQP